MALTVGCARCHDHKFDPIPTKDYYSLYGVFASSTEPKDLPLLTAAGEARSDPGLPRLREGTEGAGGRGRRVPARASPPRSSPGRAPAEGDRRLPAGRDRDSAADHDDGAEATAADLNRLLLQRWREYSNRSAERSTTRSSPRGERTPPCPPSEFAAKAARRDGADRRRRQAGAGSSTRWWPRRSRASRRRRCARWRERYAELLAKFDKPEKRCRTRSEESLRQRPPRPRLARWPSRRRGGCGSSSATPASTTRLCKRKVDEWNATNPTPRRGRWCWRTRPARTTAPVLLRGNPDNPGPVVPRQFLTILPGPTASRSRRAAAGWNWPRRSPARTTR